MEETALQYCQRLIELITLGDKDISIKSRLIHLKNKIEEESKPIGVIKSVCDCKAPTYRDEHRDHRCTKCNVLKNND